MNMTKSPNKSTLEWLKSQKHSVAICVVWTKEDADEHQTNQGLQPLTVDEWNSVLSRLEKCGVHELDWQNLTLCIDEVLNWSKHD